MGLVVINKVPPASGFLFNIVAVHGLKFHGTATSNDVWLKNVLVPRYTQAQVLSFHYGLPALPATTRQHPWHSLEDLGSALLYELYHLDSSQGPGRPTLFICHGFGAFIVKQCLNISRTSKETGLSELYHLTAGIAFLGAVHAGEHTDFDTTVVGCAISELGIDSRKGNPAFEPSRYSDGHSVLRSINTLFGGSPHNFDIISFFEEIPTKTQRSRLGPFGAKPSVLVTSELSEDKGANSKKIGLQFSHTQMMEFPPRTSIIFDEIIAQLDALQRNCEEMLTLHTQTQPSTTTTTSQQVDATSTHSSQINSSAVLLTPSVLATGIGSVGATQILPSNVGLPVTNDPPHVNLPCHMLRPHQPNPYFVGRRAVIDQMKAVLHPTTAKDQRSFLLHGLGGMGKTQTALSFIFENLDTYRSVLWAHAEDRKKLAEDFAEYAKELGLVKELGRDLDFPRTQLLNWYETTREPWLVVLDNLDLPNITDLRKVLQDFWPQGPTGAVLVTSRSRELMGTYTKNGEQLDVLDKESSTILLRKLIVDSGHEKQEDLEKVVQQVDYLPLAIMSAASYIRNDGLTAQDFLETYDNRDLVQDNEAHNVDYAASRYKHTLATVWDMEFGKFDDKAKQLLFLVAFFDADKVEERVLVKGAQKAKMPALSFISTPKAFNICRSLITRSYLVSRNEHTRQIWMHRLVRENCHLRMSPDERQIAFQCAVRLLVAELPDQENHQFWDLELRAHVRSQLSHVTSLNRFFLDSISQDPTHTALQMDAYYARLLFRAGWLLYEQGTFEEVMQMAEVAEEYCLDHPEENLDPLLSNVYRLKASIDSETNEPESALHNYQESDRWFSSAVQKGLITKPDIRHAVGIASMGHGLQGLNRFEEAEPYYHEAIKLWKDKKLPGTPVIYELGLALCLRHQGKLDEAAKVAQDVIDHWTAKHGPLETKTTFTCSAINILGDVYSAQNRMDDAYSSHVTALTLFKATWGEHHHRTADVHYKVACHEHKRGMSAVAM